MTSYATTVQESAAPYGRSIARTNASERRVILHGVSWDTYKALSKDLGEDTHCRLAFDSGDLEIISPQSHRHGKTEYRIGNLVSILAEELGLECEGAGHMTCEREDVQKAIEPDGCFYIQHAHVIEGLDSIDLTIHPPPDLMIEVDISTHSMKKLGICAALGVPEHWRYDGEILEIRNLKDGRYFESKESLAFPRLPLTEKIPEMLKLKTGDAISMIREFRAWVRGELRKAKSKRPRKR